MRSKLIVFLVGIPILITSFFYDKIAIAFVNVIENRFLDYAFSLISPFGSIFIVLMIMTTLFLWEEKKREWIPVLWASFITTFILVVGLKFIIARPRPFFIETTIFGLMDYSFPSLHAAASFTAIATLDREFPKIKWFWILFAFAVAFSRIYLRVHFLSDVIAGGLIGYIIGYLFVYLEERFKFFRRIRYLKDEKAR